MPSAAQRLRRVVTPTGSGDSALTACTISTSRITPRRIAGCPVKRSWTPVLRFRFHFRNPRNSCLSRRAELTQLIKDPGGRVEPDTFWQRWPALFRDRPPLYKTAPHMPSSRRAEGERKRVKEMSVIKHRSLAYGLF